MRAPTIGAVVRCGGQIGGVYATVCSLRNGSRTPAAIAIVAERSTPSAAHAWLAAFATARDALFLRSDALRPGAAWNTGLRALPPVDYAICIEAGDLLERSALETLAGRAATDDRISIVTCGIEWLGPGTRRSFTCAQAISAADLLVDPHLVHASALFRRSEWSESSGFDETMSDLEFADFWLRLLERGGRLVAESAPLLRRRVQASPRQRRSMTVEGHREAAASLYERHWPTTVAAAGALLEAKERLSVRVHVRHQDAVATLREVRADCERMGAERQRLLHDVPPDWEPGLDFGAFARTSPLAHDWGYERGTPADRELIERYLAASADDIHGIVLEIQEDDYTRRFGGPRVARGDVLDVDVTNPRATLIGDLRSVPHLESEHYDCIILTQTLHVIDDMRAVLQECERLLKPGGVLLATMPSASRVCLEYGPEGDFWRVTGAGALRLFEDVFPSGAVSIRTLGNPLTNLAFGYGLGAEELPPDAYDTSDPYFPMVIGVRAEKPGRTGPTLLMPRTAERRGAVLMYHRVGATGPDPHRLSVSEPVFRSQLAWLKASCSVVPLETLARGIPSANGERRVAVTFDDGYVDALTTAMPILSGVALPATFFLTSAEAPDPYHYWWDRLSAALLTPPSVPAPLTVDLPSGRHVIQAMTDAERREAHRTVYDEIVRLPAAPRDAIVDRIAAWAGRPALRDDDRRLTWNEVRTLAQMPGASVGGHTVDHLYLPAQPDAVVAEQLAANRTTLERETGRPVDSLAYPFGAHNRRGVALARDAGFRTAVTCAASGVGPLHDPLALPRIEVTDVSLPRFVEAVEQALRFAR